jgi:hypothetical protein
MDRVGLFSLGLLPELKETNNSTQLGTEPENIATVLSTCQSPALVQSTKSERFVLISHAIQSIQLGNLEINRLTTLSS